MVEATQYTSQDLSKRSSWFGSNKGTYDATWKNPAYSNVGVAQPVQPVVLQPSVLGQTSQSTLLPTQASTTSSSLLPSVSMSGGLGTGNLAGGSGLATGQPLITSQTLNAPPVNQVEHVYEKKVINQPYVHQVVHHPINEIHQQHLRNDVYTQPVTQVIPEQRFVGGTTTGMYSSGAGFTPGMTTGAAAPTYHKQGFLEKLKAKRAQRKLAKQQQQFGMGGTGTQAMPYGTTAATTSSAPIVGPSTSQFGAPALYQQQQYPSSFQSGITGVPLQQQSSSYLTTTGSQYGVAQQPGLGGSWISGQPRI